MKVTLNVAAIELLEEKLNAFKKKFAKYGNGSVVYTKSEPYRDADKTSQHYNEQVVDVEIEAAYRICDFEFIATLSWNDDAQENIIRKASADIIIPSKYRYSTACDHCHTNRRRIETVLLRNINTHEYVQVGKACVKDYLGRDITDYARYLSFYDDVEKAIDNLGYYTRICCFSTIEVIQQACEYTIRYGYISKKSAEDNMTDSTSSIIYAAMNEITVNGRIKYELLPISDKAAQMASRVIDFVNNADLSDDYMNNLHILINNNTVDNKNLGMLVSAVGCYVRNENNKATAKAASTSNYIGNIGDKISIICTPECIYSAPSEYSWLYIYKFISDSGDVLIWKTSKKLDNASINIKGTIKAHNEFRGVKQTELTRCRVSE